MFTNMIKIGVLLTPDYVRFTDVTIFVRCRKVSKIISQSNMYVGLDICYETKKRGAGIGKGSPLFLRALAVCVFAPAIP